MLNVLDHLFQRWEDGKNCMTRKRRGQMVEVKLEDSKGNVEGSRSFENDYNHRETIENVAVGSRGEVLVEGVVVGASDSSESWTVKGLEKVACDWEELRGSLFVGKSCRLGMGREQESEDECLGSNGKRESLRYLVKATDFD